MGTTLLTFGGWALLCALLLFFVRWVGIERAFFSGQDPENWRPGSLRQIEPVEDERPTPVVHSSHAASLGRLA